MKELRLRAYSAIVAALERTSNQDEIHSLCCELCKILGFDNFIYALRLPTSFVKPHLLVLSGYPEQWRKRYREQEYHVIDPTVAFCATNSLPLPWDRLKQLEQSDPAVGAFMEESRDFGLLSGLSIPIHDGRGGRGIFSLSSRKPPEQMQSQIEESIPLVHAISFHIHEALRRTTQDLKLRPSPHALSEREIECLRWAAEGKTSWETSQILGISERTVVFHIQKASDKLSVCNRSHAVARAVSLGMIF